MRLRLMLALVIACFAGCQPEDTACSPGAVRCPTDRSIEFCDDGVWAGPEACAPREGAGGLEITTYCYPDQGVCAP